MFDADTVALIAGAPALEGLDLGSLPQRLTEAYAAIVSTRIRLREGEVATAELAKTIDEMKRIAAAHEAFVSVSPQREDRAAAAFVAGSAHHACLMAEKLSLEAGRASVCGIDWVSPEVAATLLYLVAEATADAAELSKSIVPSDSSSSDGALMVAIQHLANGRLLQIVERPLIAPPTVSPDGPEGVALGVLFHLLLKGVRALAHEMLGSQDESVGDAALLFDRVMSLSVTELDQVFSGSEHSVFNAYPGPRHLAALLSAVAKDLRSSAVVRIAPPGGVDGTRWLKFLREAAKRRPYLWRNHRQAIDAGYLEPGISSAISFPTGAGKSTLAELKIATAVLRGTKTVFLAPTLALVDQTARALQATFPTADVLKDRSDDAIGDLSYEPLPSISVLTPESCLAMMGANRDIFSDVGLVVFDECHLLHPREADTSRRSIDAMLCILNLTAIAPSADLVFLSAMMKNCSEMAEWIEELTSRTCVALELTWKPTRQVRGCVVYGEAEINALTKMVSETRSAVTNQTPPESLKRQLLAQPFGFFCLRQTWQSTARQDYSLLPLLDDHVLLGTGSVKEGRKWYLTPNGNQVAAAIAGATSRQRIKTLVFTQTIPLANSASKNLCEALAKPTCELSEEEQRLYAAALDELGDPSRLYLSVAEGSQLVSPAACHHGLLLPTERLLHESLFKRADGIDVLVATSTLAQGMNLPSQVVVIAGDSRFDAGANKMEQLQAHELLNAAGRAGRAGDGSYGFVLVVPSKVVHFNNSTNTIHKHWADLRAIFSQSDQCLVIDDPCAPLLDQIHASTIAQPFSAEEYLLRRLPVSGDTEISSHDELARALLEKSFAAFRARKRGDQEWIKTRISAALSARSADPDLISGLSWVDRLAAASGFPPSVIRELADKIRIGAVADGSVRYWHGWLMAWLAARPHLIPLLVRRESLEGFLGSPYKKLQNDSSRGKYGLPYLSRLLDGWMRGDTLESLEISYGTKLQQVGKCQSARDFVLRIVPELAYLFALPKQIHSLMFAEGELATDAPLALALLGPCVKYGVDRLEKLALRQLQKGSANRRSIHRQYETIKSYVGLADPDETFGDLLQRVDAGLVLSSLVS